MKRRFLLTSVFTLALAMFTSASAAEGWPANYSGVMLQGFYWDSYTDSKWSVLTERADELSQYFNLIWIPNAGTVTSTPAYESTTTAMGYSPLYYLKDNTIFGTESELRTMINTYKAKGTGIIEDVVINHKNGETGWCDFANESVIGQNTGKTYTITWDNTNYSGICNTDEANSDSNSGVAGKITGASDTGDDFDGCRDLDHTNSTVQQNLITYQDYLLNELGFAGFRLDMVKGYAAQYTKLYNEAVNPQYCVGEYWDSKDPISNWIKNTGYTSAAFDFPLKFVLNSVFDDGNWNALSDKSFTADASLNRYSVTFVDNHDTFRSNKLNNSWSAANAFILAMPGTPCIFLPHYTADPTHIQAMIKARKACGITNQSTILHQYQYNSGYVIETQGTNGNVYLQLGDATGLTAPDGYILKASATDGTPYKFYATYVAPKVSASVESSTFTTNTINVTLTPNSIASSAKYKVGDGEWTAISSATTLTLGENLSVGESVTVSWEATDADSNTASGLYTYTKAEENTDPITVYFNNTANWSSVYAYMWNSTTGVYKTAWPGTQITETTDQGYYKFEIDDDSNNMIIFNNGSDIQTADLNVVANRLYSANGITPSYSGYRLYFKNTSSWSTVNCYSWTGDTKYSGNWPGSAMTYDSNTGYYYIDFTNAPANVIFNNGNGTQTADLTFTNGNLYDASGSSSSYAEETLVLADGTAYTSTTDAVKPSVSYTRSSSNAWGTLCLPFAYTSSEDVQFYTIKGSTESSVVVSPITSVSAGQPVIYEILSDADATTDKYILSVSATDAIVKSADYGKSISPIDDWTMKGTYSATTIVNDETQYRYYIASNKFWFAAKSTAVPAYRAWLEGPVPTESSAKAMTISVFKEGDVSTSIYCLQNINADDVSAPVYNIQGQRLSAPQKGINIINGKKILVK